jgi:predicted nucleic acid-binding protein
MAYLLDTGVLLRLVNEEDTEHDTVTLAIEQLVACRQRLVTTTQNVGEFWYVATRAKLQNGLGLTADRAFAAIGETIEAACAVVREHSQHFKELKRLLTAYQILGKQVHDARLVASMLTWKIERILTLNEKHFKRFEPEGIAIETPRTILQTS